MPKKQNIKLDKELKKNRQELITSIQKNIDEIDDRFAPFVEGLKLCSQIKDDKSTVQVFNKLKPTELDKLKVFVRTARGLTRSERVYLHSVLRRYATYFDGTLDTEIQNLYEEGKHDEGLVLVRKWLSKVKMDDHLFAREGLCLLRLGRPREAIASFDQSIAIHAGTFAWWVFRGDAYADLGEYDAAIRDFTISFSLSDDNWSAYDKCARAFYLSGRTEEAIQYEEYAVKKGGDSEATLVLVEMLKRIGELERAQAVAKKGWKKFPKDARFQEALEAL
jgi:tetratricopeptide (TPR) repeat protein